MLYSQFMREVMELVIIDDDESSGYSYQDPHYRVLMADAGLDPACVTDHPLDWAYVTEVLKLEVERRNKITDKGRFVADWLFDVITATINPTMVAEENDLMKNMMEYMKLNHELKEREAEVERKEEIQEKKSNIVEMMPGINFSKRGAK